MSTLSGRWPFQFPAGGASLVPWQDHFEDLAQSVADQLNEYQVPISVSGSSQRGSLFPSPSDGDRVWRTDLDREEYYNGSAWVSPVRAVFEAVGNVTQTTNVAVGDTVTFSPTFPVGRFTVAPRVFLTPGNSRFTTSFANITTSGFDLSITNQSNGTSGGSFDIYWHAIQMTTAAANG